MQEKTTTLHEIIEQMFDFSQYEAEDKKQVIEETAALVMEASLLRAIELADEKTQEKFDTFIQAEPSEDEMTNFISENFSDFENIVAEELKTLKEMHNEE